MEKYFDGYVEAEVADDYTIFYRFSEAQRDYYYRESEWFGMNSRCMAGMVLKVSKCRKLAFDYKVFLNTCDKETRFDLWCDGKMRKQLSFAAEEGRVEFPVNGEDVAVYFPYYQSVGLKNIVVEGEAAEKSDRVIWALGDSITQGYWLDTPSLAYPAHLSRELDARVYNFGIGGCPMQTGVLSDMPILPVPKVIFFAYGCNDWRLGRDYQRAVRDMFDKLRQAHPQVPIVVILPITKVGEEEDRGCGSLEDVRRGIARSVMQYPNVHVLHCGRKIDPGKHLSPDGTHPCDEGIGFLAENVLAEALECIDLREALSRG